MAAAELKLKIGHSIQAFSKGSLTANALHLFQTLGYNTERQAPLDKPTYTEFKENYIQPSSPFNETKALVGEWKYVDLLFQLSKEEVLKQTLLFTTKQVDRTAIEAYLLFTIELSGDHYSRTDLAHITREVNRLFAMPVMILFKHGNLLTLSVINRRLHKRDDSKDVLEKVTLIKDIQIQNPHRAHIEILFDLSFDELKNKYSFTNFVELHNAWQKTLDTKELNKRFYRELANWYFWAVQNVEFPADTETVRDVRNATNVIRLITRLIFVWFLKEKGLIPDEFFNQNRLQQILKYIDDNNSTYYKAILQNLFFATLNTEMGKRQFRNRAKREGNRDQHYMIHNVFRYEGYFAAPEETLKKYFSNIPFLNGGLFECLDRVVEVSPPLKKGGEGGFSEKKIVRIDGFTDRKDNALRVPDELFFSDEQAIDLNNIYGTKNKTYRARGIINLLNSYKFTIDENTPVEEEVALDPELLGKVFENLLASYNPETGSTARKQTGSFYTPREIVNYMVDESLIAYLQTKLASSFETIPSPHVGEPSKNIPSPLTGEGQGGGEKRLRHLFSYTDEPHQFNPNEVDILIDAIDSAKVLDPACGSGAFPMGILHKLVYILSKLDPNNQKWRQRQIHKVMEVPDVTVREKLIEDIEQAFQSNELDYGRKLYLIENAIFGVDIQPIAVQIAKLRFFISLIVDQKISHTSPPLAGGAGGGGNLGIRPLPNLETKFVAANTLIGIEKPQQLTLRNPDIDKKEEELKKVRERHFTARTPQTKEKYRMEDERLRTEIAEMLRNDGFPAGVTKKLAEWNPYDQNTSADFFDPEWMFGVKSPSPFGGESKGEGGFDIVIGNPPYVQIQNINIDNEYLKYLKTQYFAAQYKVDLYHLFIEAGINLLGFNGVLSYITPNTFLKNKHNNRLRNLMMKNRILTVLLFYSRVFDDPSVDNVVFLLQKKVSANEVLSNQIIVREIREGDFVEQLQKGRVFPQQNITSPEFAFEIDITSETAHVLTKIENGTIPFGKIGGSYFGIQTFDRKIYVSSKKKNDYFMPVIDGGNVFRYFTTTPSEFVDFQPQNIKSGGDPNIYTRERIVVRQIGRYPEGAICPHGVLTLNTIYNIYINDSNFDLRYILALLNSHLLQFYWLQRFYDNKETFPKIKKQPLHSIPIKGCTAQVQKNIVVLVESILAAKQNPPSPPFAKGGNKEVDTSALERQIDEMVYKLYDLTPEEIKVVENSTK